MTWISPTQISTYRSCPRKWGFRAIDRIEIEQNESAKFGSEGHERIERYYATGTAFGDDDIGSVIRMAFNRKLLPLPLHCGGLPLLESSFKTPVGEGDILVGKIDFVLPSQKLLIDHKFTKSKKYALTEGELREDIQALIYSIATCRMLLHVDENTEVFGDDHEDIEITNRWVYYVASGSSRPRKVVGAYRREITRTYHEALERLSGWMPTIREISAAKKEIKAANELTPMFDACGAYGGCPYVEHCKASRDDRLIGRLFGRPEEITVKEGDHMMSSVMEILNKKMNKKVEPEALHLKQQSDGATGVNPPPVEKQGSRNTRSISTASENQKPAYTRPFTLYVNCVPLKGRPEEVILASDILQQCARAVCGRHGVEHIFCLEYGKGSAELAAEVGRYMDTEWESEALMIDSRTKEASIVLDGLIARADEVIRGM
jgi:RecB family exonuclease